MTTTAMSAGMLSAALSLVEGDPSFRQPMATVVIGGLITSTFLSLLVIPVAYGSRKPSKKLLRRVHGKDAASGA